MLIFLSICLVIAQAVLSQASLLSLCFNWCFAVVLAVGVWNVTKRYHLCGVYDSKAIPITLPLLSSCLNFSLCYFPRTEQFYFSILLLGAMLAALSLLLSFWQNKVAISHHLLVGIILGLSSTFLPHALLWLLLIPMLAYHMRCWSTRNTFSSLTGAILGVWIGYFFLFLWGWCSAQDDIYALANHMLLQYTNIITPGNINDQIAQFGLWQWLFLGLIALLVVIYSITSLLLNTSGSIRVAASISLISTLSIFTVVLSLIDVAHLTFYVSLLALFLCIQLTIHQAKVRTSFNEWWTLFIIIAMNILTALPLFFQSNYDNIIHL